MPKQLTFTEAFARYGATLANPQWAVSAIARDGAFVMSCWKHYTRTVDDALVYTDTLSRWRGNRAGNQLLRKHLEEAHVGNYPVRCLIARTEETVAVDEGHDASKVKKIFYVRPELIGRIVLFDGDRFEIRFAKIA
jgi:hypothetical protein